MIVFAILEAVVDFPHAFGPSIRTAPLTCIRAASYRSAMRFRYSAMHSFA
jgi:hypothetical protein